MANRYAVANGNWSAPGTWDGGTTVPGAGDTVRPNNFNVTIDQSITVTELRSDASSPAVANGQFVVSTASGQTVTTTNAIRQNGTSNGAITSAVVLVSATTGTVNFVCGLTSLANGMCAIGITGAATVNLTGDINTLNDGSNTINSSASGTINVTGNVTHNGNGASIFCSAVSAIVNITGDVKGSTTGASGFAIQATGGSSTVTVTGNCAGQVGGQCISSGSNAATSITITGNVTGGSSSGRTCVANTGSTSSSIDIGGTVTAGSAAGAHAVNALNCVTRVGGNIIQQNARAVAVLGPWVKKVGQAMTLAVKTDSSGFNLTGTTESLIIDANVAPAVTDVRNGVSYGSGPWTGTMKVPTAASVAAGVPVDNTTGTAALKLSDVAAVTGAQMAAVMEKT